MRWAAEVSSSVYSTPLIADVFGDGTKEVIVPTFVHYLELLEARRPPASRSARRCNERCARVGPFCEALR